MKSITTFTKSLKGSSYEIGCQLGRFVNTVPKFKSAHTAGFPGFDKDMARAAVKLFERYCPGLTEELAGFSDTLKIMPEQIVYSAMTYLHPNCSHMALMPGITENGHPLLARNYEFNENAEDFILVKTSVKGKYTHIGTSVLGFGRDDGFNEHGLAVTMSSCGFPVGAVKTMRSPAIIGLQFWAVIRSLLENCRNVEEALDFIRDMPIACNLNLILLDRQGCGALVETLDGRLGIKKISGQEELTYLHATNHPLLPELIPYEPHAMKNSLIRYQWISDKLNSKDRFSKEDLKVMLLSEYPNGLTCHYYEDFFGTTKSMVIDPFDGTIDLCWGGRKENGWRTYEISQPLSDAEISIELETTHGDCSMFELQPLTKL